MKNVLDIKNLKVLVDDTEVIKDISLSINAGETHSIMGPNGSGKSSLALTIMGHPNYNVTNGSILFHGEDLSKLKADERSKKGIFLAFQNPIEIEGVTIKEFLYQTYMAHFPDASLQSFEKALVENLKLLKIKNEFIGRSINFGFSGGEKKRVEILQLAMIKPKLAILDEIDSGLDVDALKAVCFGINQIKKEHSDMALIIITHYPRILHYLTTQFVHIMKKGEIVQSDGADLAEQIEKHGYSKNTRNER